MSGFVLILWLAMGATDVEYFATLDACNKRLGEQVRYFSAKYVVEASGCYPQALIIKAAQTTPASPEGAAKEH